MLHYLWWGETHYHVKQSIPMNKLDHTEASGDEHMKPIQSRSLSSVTQLCWGLWLSHLRLETRVASVKPHYNPTLCSFHRRGKWGAQKVGNMLLVTTQWVKRFMFQFSPRSPTGHYKRTTVAWVSNYTRQVSGSPRSSLFCSNPSTSLMPWIWTPISTPF